MLQRALCAQPIVLDLTKSFPSLFRPIRTVNARDRCLMIELLLWPLSLLILLPVIFVNAHVEPLWVLRRV